MPARSAPGISTTSKVTPAMFAIVLVSLLKPMLVGQIRFVNKANNTIPLHLLPLTRAAAKQLYYRTPVKIGQDLARSRRLGAQMHKRTGGGRGHSRSGTWSGSRGWGAGGRGSAGFRSRCGWHGMMRHSGRRGEARVVTTTPPLGHRAGGRRYT